MNVLRGCVEDTRCGIGTDGHLVTELLESMVRHELLVQEARRQGLDQDPAVKTLMEKMMVQQLIQKASATEATDAEARAYYEAHSAEFNRPERIRVSHLLLTAKDPKTAKSETARVLGRFRSLQEPALSSAFLEEVRRSSADDRTKSADGDVGLLTRDELSAQFGATVADAAFGLRVIGEVGAPVEDEKGIHFLKLGGRQPGLTTSFADARGRIAGRLAAEGRAKALESLVTSLRAQAKVEVREAALSAVKLDGAPALGPPDAG